MSAVAQLVLAYFTRTPGLRWLSLGGLIAIVACLAVLPRVAGNVVSPIAFLGDGSVIAFLGGASLFIGAGLMPTMVARMALSHTVCVLPHGRLKLFLSAFITVAIVSIPVPLLGVVWQYLRMPSSVLAPYTTWQMFAMVSYLFWSFYVGTFLVATWLYVAIGFAATERNMAGLLKSLLVILAVIYTPSERIAQLDPKFQLTAWESVLSWAGIGTWIALAPRWRGARVRGATLLRLLRRLFRYDERARYAAGREFELLLGTARPWLLVLAMLFPVAIQTLVGARMPNTWLFYFTLFSTISGALAGRAAERSRSLWLRARWSRPELFAHVEFAFWKHNSFALVVLAILLVAVAHLYELPPRVVLLGIPLLVLAMLVSTYVGLMMTRGLRWLESSLAIVLMLALMGVAVLAASERSDEHVVIAFEVVLALIGITLRFIARHRWHRLDWMLCRADRADDARAVS